MSFSDLPVETVHHIFSYFDDPHDISALAGCNRLLNEIGSDAVLWAPHLATTWRYSNKTISDLYVSSSRARPVVEANSQELFRRRKQTDRKVEECIQSIVDQPCGRFKHVETISNHFMDAADAVRNFRLRHGRVKKNYGIDYYCCLVERHLSRKLGIHILQKMRSNPDNYRDGLAPLFALYGIGAFRLSDGLDLHLPTALDDLVANVNALCRAEPWASLPLYVASSGIETNTKVNILLRALAEAGISPAREEDYYDLRNSFLYCAMKERRPTIPITMVAIFVALATRMGLECQPIGFPGQVLALVQEDAQSVYVSPYEDGRVYLKSELVARLQAHGSFDTERHLSPCTIQELCNRSAGNILNCIERGSDSRPLDGLYAALVTLKLIGQRIPLAEDQFITLVSRHFPYDLLIWEQMNHPDHEEIIRQTRLEDHNVREPKRRVEQAVEIRHRVGTVFRHALFNYVAVVTGWDDHCYQSAEWISQMRVNSLERKADQPFYQVLAADGSERYVAEDNILPITSNEVPVLHTLTSLELIGKYFKSHDGEKFILSSDLEQAFPDF